ncbi:MAG TPA: N-acetylmuramoyl-L-alanine amidase, partial [Longimicrobium sp.]|nr:N-acetylmuramoyl-L-alanine amidase [Longimicrobium sp.]
MRLLTVLLLVLLPSHPGFLPAQPPPQTWRLVLGDETSLVAEATSRGYAAFPVSALMSLGAQLSYGGGEVTARFGAREVRFRVDSPEVLADGRALAMANPVYAADGVVFIPAEFLATILPQAAPGAVSVDAGARIVRADAGALAALAPAPAPVAPAVALPQPGPQQRRLVVIDAGHGGVDPGAVGPGGTREKDINLQMARRVVEILRQDPTLDVRLTRNRDTLIALRD